MQRGHDASGGFVDIVPHQFRRQPQHAIPKPTEVTVPPRVRSAFQFMRPVINFNYDLGTHNRSTARIAANMPLLLGLVTSGDGPDRAVTRTFSRSYPHSAGQAHSRTADNPSAFGPWSAPQRSPGIILGSGRCARLRFGNVPNPSPGIPTKTELGHFPRLLPSGHDGSLDITRRE